MNKILNEATDAVRFLPLDEQDEVAREIRLLALEAQGFKAVPGGYAFRVPSPWMFGRAYHYRATDAHVEGIAAARNTLSDIALAACVAALAVVVVLLLPAACLPADRGIGRVALVIVQGGMLVLAQMQCFRWLAFQRLRSVVAYLPRMNE